MIALLSGYPELAICFISLRYRQPTMGQDNISYYVDTDLRGPPER